MGKFLALRVFRRLRRVVTLLAVAIAPTSLMLAVAPAVAAAEKKGDRPNVILILVDDLGVNDIGLNSARRQGGIGPLVSTPNIDRLGKEGINFTRAYTGHATCAPSRAALMTGRYPQRFGFEFNPGGSAFTDVFKTMSSGGLPVRVFEERLNGRPVPQSEGMPGSEFTIAEMLLASGYRTAFFGKWHLGFSPDKQPGAQGFEHWLGFLGGASLFAPRDEKNIVSAQLAIDRQLWDKLPYSIIENGKPFPTREYLTDLWTQETLRYIDRKDERPFFIYLAHNAPHNPLQAPKSDYDAVSAIKDETSRVYAAMMLNLDRNIGTLMDGLAKRNIDRKTLVIFASDNGGAAYTDLWVHNLPFRGAKGSFWEGGLRTPLFMRWPGRIAAGQQSRSVAAFQDILPTIAAISGSTIPVGVQTDGRSILTGKMRPDRRSMRSLFWRAGDVSAVMSGDWKLIETARPEPGRIWLYDLKRDPLERINLAKRKPRVAASLRKKLIAHFAGMKPSGPLPAVELPVRADPPLPAGNVERPENIDYVYWPG
jgi:arylsulfatase A-like enzyme